MSSRCFIVTSKVLCGTVEFGILVVTEFNLGLDFSRSCDPWSLHTAAHLSQGSPPGPNEKWVVDSNTIKLLVGKDGTPTKWCTILQWSNRPHPLSPAAMHDFAKHILFKGTTIHHHPRRPDRLTYQVQTFFTQQQLILYSIYPITQFHPKKHFQISNIHPSSFSPPDLPTALLWLVLPAASTSVSSLKYAMEPNYTIVRCSSGWWVMHKVPTSI